MEMLLAEGGHARTAFCPPSVLLVGRLTTSVSTGSLTVTLTLQCPLTAAGLGRRLDRASPLQRTVCVHPIRSAREKDVVRYRLRDGTDPLFVQQGTRLYGTTPTCTSVYCEAT